ncbi:conserved hypothetical protein [Histoplasma capsulatum H143]|uniref:Uncharacterized protein n=1 Tax=Ajellomyces capsulatus (strain H143) TaxID=544712 RepID=C6H3M9_AJECH|nr:conserved hypothetical protein [Histoplasma capsulatum H143]
MLRLRVKNYGSKVDKKRPTWPPATDHSSGAPCNKRGAIVKELLTTNDVPQNIGYFGIVYDACWASLALSPTSVIDGVIRCPGNSNGGTFHRLQRPVASQHLTV